MRKYRFRGRWMTVILLYPDYMCDDFGHDIYVEWAKVPARAKDPVAAAVRIVRAKARKANPVYKDMTPEDFAVVAVMAGKITLLADSYSAH